MKLAIQLRDPLNYGYHRRNLVLNLEALACPNGTAWHYLHHQGDSAIGESLSSLVRWQDLTTTSLHQFDSWCPTPQFNSAINKRLITLAEEVMAHVKTSPEQGSYLYEVGDRVCRLQWTQGNVDAARYARKHDLNAILAQTRQELFMTHVDHYLDPDGLYQLLLHNQHSGQVRVFIDTQRTETHIFVLDELGHLDKLKPTQLKESTLLANLNQFLGEIPTLNHNKAAFYKLHHIDGGWTAKLLTLPEVKTSNTYLPVIVTMDSTQVDSSCVISCGPKTFTGKTNDIELFKQLSQFILTLRQSDNHFPLYITQLMFKQSSPIPTTHDYLAFKQHIENLLNIR
jgi:adenylate cyclase class 1